MPDYKRVGERRRSVETAFSMTRRDKTQSGHTGLLRLLWNACQKLNSSCPTVCRLVCDLPELSQLTPSAPVLSAARSFWKHHASKTLPSFPPTPALQLLKLLCHGEASSGHQCYGPYWAYPWKNIFYLPINMSSSRSISRASAACWSQELCCFARLLKNSAFSICLAKFIRSCNESTFRHHDGVQMWGTLAEWVFESMHLQGNWGAETL